MEDTNQTHPDDDLSVEGLEDLAQEINTPEEPETPDAPEMPESDPLADCKEELLEAEKAVGAAQDVLSDALKTRNECNKRYMHLRSTAQLSLHELNQQQKKITRVENARRFRAQEAIDKMVGHYRPGKRDSYPLSPSAKAAVGSTEE